MKKKSITIPKKYTNKSPGQTQKMKSEIKKFKDKKAGNPFFLWSGDRDSKTGRAYATKKGKATIAYHKKFGKKSK